MNVINLAKEYFERFGICYDDYGSEISHHFNDFLNRTILDIETIRYDFHEIFQNPNDLQRKLIDKLIQLHESVEPLYENIWKSYNDLLYGVKFDSIKIEYQFEILERKLTHQLYVIHGSVLYELLESQ